MDIPRPGGNFVAPGKNRESWKLKGFPFGRSWKSQVETVAQNSFWRSSIIPTVSLLAEEYITRGQ
jgi:hypothetical protein